MSTTAIRRVLGDYEGEFSVISANSELRSLVDKISAITSERDSLRKRVEELERKVTAWDSTVHRVKTLRARGTGRIVFVHEITQHVEYEMSKMPLEEIPTNDAKA